MEDAIAFAEKIFALLDETRYTATYKFAVLLGLMDLCLENTSRSGTPPDFVTTRQLAERVTEIYWPHTLPYSPANGIAILRQASAGQAEVPSCIARFRTKLKDPSAPLIRARLTAPDLYSKLLDQVEFKLIEMPLPRVQTIGTSVDRFIYSINWDEHITQGEVSRTRKGSREFDNRILFKPDAAEHLVRLNGLLRPLIHRRWAAMVARLNGQEDSRLEDFLFGADRLNLAAVRVPLWEIHEGRCFYCQQRMRDPKMAHVDHFIPWSRYQENGLFNLVIADQTCNGNKSDFIADVDHMDHWLDRFRDASPVASQLQTLAQKIKWELARDRMQGVAHAIYLPLREDSKLWRTGREFVNADPARISQLFAEV